MQLASDAVQYVLRALRAGAAWFLVPTPPEDLIGLVQVATEMMEKAGF